MRRLILAVPLILAAVVGCSGPVVQRPLTPAADWANQSAPPAMLTFGQTHTWPGGDTVTVSAPRRMTEAPSIIDGRAGQFLVVDITVHNGGQATRSASDYLTMATINDRSVDYAAMRGHTDLVRSNASIPPGGALAWSEAYPVTDTGAVRFAVQMSGSQADPQRPVVFYQGTA